MASSNYTTNLGLCSWAASDRPKRSDFVNDNGIIDNILGGHVNNTAVHMSTAEKSKALYPFETAIYSGDGESSRAISVGFRPTFAIVYKKNSPPVIYSGGVNVINSGYACYGHPCTSGVVISSNGVTVQQQSTAVDGVRISLNETDCQYLVVAFK